MSLGHIMKQLVRELFKPHSTKSYRRALRGASSRGFFKRAPSGSGRVTRCHQCKRQLVATLGAKCNYCHWIRCPCGACGCSYGRMA